MSTQKPLLSSLKISNFRLLENFQVSKLGHVNLLVGKNNSGKSSVLEALQIFAGNAHPLLLQKIAAGHDEKVITRKNEVNGIDTVLPFEDFFTGRRFPKNDDTKIEIGEISSSTGLAHLLQIQHVFLAETKEMETNNETGETITRIKRSPVMPSEFADMEDEPVKHALFVTKGERSSIISFDISGHYRLNDNTIPCSTVPTQFVSADELAGEWDKIVFQPEEETITKAMQIIEPDFQGLAFVNEAEDQLHRLVIGDYFEKKIGQLNKISGRSPKVKMSGLSRPVPLNSLGDGMLRVFHLILKVFPAKNGFLLIDEFENGLHYSVQEKIWTLLFKLSKELNIQIFATTHSWDCIESFSRVAKQNTDIEGVLFRVGKSARESNRGQVIATVFDKEQLHNITQTDVEVR